MNKTTIISSMFLALLLCFLILQKDSLAQNSMVNYCLKTYQQTQECPTDDCLISCVTLKKGEGCTLSCYPKDCTKISVDKCPPEYCDVLNDCSGQKTCHFKMIGEPPKCGDVAYAGQDIECCPGLVKRCGIEFYDGSCDMEGKHSIYNLPICIPCGDGVCVQFENRCNCPEDCP